MGHLDRTVFEKDTLLEIAESGCYLEWDLFGQENHYYLNGKLKLRYIYDYGIKTKTIRWKENGDLI